METILYNISQVIGVAVIHSLWQGLIGVPGATPDHLTFSAIVIGKQT